MWYKKYRQRTKGDSYYKSCPLPTAHADGLKLGERVWWAKTIKKEERKYVTFFIILVGLVQAAEKKVSLSLSLSQALLSPCIIIHSVSGFQAFRLLGLPASVRECYKVKSICQMGEAYSLSLSIIAGKLLPQPNSLVHLLTNILYYSPQNVGLTVFTTHCDHNAYNFPPNMALFVPWCSPFDHGKKKISQ